VTSTSLSTKTHFPFAPTILSDFCPSFDQVLSCLCLFFQVSLETPTFDFLFAPQAQEQKNRSGIEEARRKGIGTSWKSSVACPGELEGDRTSFQIVAKLQVSERCFETQPFVKIIVSGELLILRTDLY
jgi:hypothetical protein